MRRAIRGKGPTPTARFMVLERDWWQCVRCGQTVQGIAGWDYSLQHRVARGMGGSKRPRINLPANLVTLCGSGTTGCHGHIETTAEGKVEARENGWALSQHTEDPQDWPVSLWDANGLRITAWLDNEGGVHTDDPSER